MSKRAPALSRGALFRGLGRAGMLLGSTLGLVLVLAGCAGSGRQSGVAAGGSASAGATGSDSSSPGVPSTSVDAPCKQWSCTPELPVQLGGGYSVRLWSSLAPTAVLAPDRSTPVLQLLRDGRHLQWWQARSGFGWEAKLDCLAAHASVPAQCAVLAEVGSHAGIAQLVLLHDGALISPSRASVSFDGGRPMSADLDHDGWLDVLGTENDYQPNYATGHNFWATYRFDGESLQRTGCVLRRTPAGPPPDRLLTGACPVVTPA
jgi:hypothetical protein